MNDNYEPQTANELFHESSLALSNDSIVVAFFSNIEFSSSVQALFLLRNCRTMEFSLWRKHRAKMRRKSQTSSESKFASQAIQVFTSSSLFFCYFFLVVDIIYVWSALWLVAMSLLMITQWTSCSNLLKRCSFSFIFRFVNDVQCEKKSKIEHRSKGASN